MADDNSEDLSRAARLRAWAKAWTWQGWTDRWLHRITLVVILATTVYMAIAVRAPHVTLGDSPGFGQVLVNNRGVVLAIWIIATDGAIFLLASLLARTAAKEWARSAGPVDTGDDPAAEPKDDVRGLIERALELYAEAQRKIEGLTTRLQDTESDYADAVRELKAAEEKVTELQGKSGQQ